jgi:hypothetical protein
MDAATADEIPSLGREALAAADWERARACFEQAAQSSESAEMLDGLGEALHFGGEHARAIEVKERAFAAYERRGLRAEAAELGRWRSYTPPSRATTGARRLVPAARACAPAERTAS